MRVARVPRSGRRGRRPWRSVARVHADQPAGDLPDAEAASAVRRSGGRSSDPVDAAIVEVAEEQPDRRLPDGLPLRPPPARRRGQPQAGAAGDARAEADPAPRRSSRAGGGPAFFRVERPGQLWHLDMTSIWVAEHGWCYLNAIIDCCTREIVGWSLELRCRADEAIAVIKQAVDEQGIAPGTLTLGTDNGSAFTARATRLALSALGVTHRRGGYRDPEIAGVHRELVLATSRSAASGATSSRPSTRPGR